MPTKPPVIVTHLYRLKRARKKKASRPADRSVCRALSKGPPTGSEPSRAGTRGGSPRQAAQEGPDAAILRQAR
jgi:hypothetical protein